MKTIDVGQRKSTRKPKQPAPAPPAQTNQNQERPKSKKTAQIDTCLPINQVTPRRRYLALRTKESTPKIVTQPLKPIKSMKSTISSKTKCTESTPTSSTKKKEDISSPSTFKPEPSKLTKGTQNIIKNFENLQRNSDIIESGLRGSTKQMKARVKILEQGTVRDRD